MTTELLDGVLRVKTNIVESLEGQQENFAWTFDALRPLPALDLPKE